MCFNSKLIKIKPFGRKKRPMKFMDSNLDISDFLKIILLLKMYALSTCSLILQPKVTFLVFLVFIFFVTFSHSIIIITFYMG